MSQPSIPPCQVDNSVQNSAQKSISKNAQNFQNIEDFPSLMNLLREQSDLIKSLQKTIEVLNVRLEKSEANGSYYNDALKIVPKNVRESVQENVRENVRENVQENVRENVRESVSLEQGKIKHKKTSVFSVVSDVSVIFQYP